MPVEQLSYGLPIRELVLVGLVSAVVALLLTGPVRMLALKVGAVAWPRGRDVHVTPTPRWGGLAMFGGVLAGLLLALQLPALRLAYFEGSTDVLGTVVAAALLVGIGVLDDRFDLDAITKFAAQVTAGGLLVLYGVQWLTLWIPLGGGGTGISGSTLVLGQAQGVLLTVLVTVAMVNAMNFVDGLDGLAAGIGLIASLATAAFCIGLIRENGNDVGSYSPALIAVVLAGACLGFLPHNFNPARIFMGDTGSMLVGVMLAAAVTSASGKIVPDEGTSATDYLGLLAPVIVVIGVVCIPLLDLLLAVVRRTRAGTSPFSPDKMHLHHRLLQVGHSHRRAVLLAYLWVAVLAFGAVALALLPQTGLVLTAIGIALAVAYVASAVPHRSRMRTAAAQAAAPPAADADGAPPAAGVDTDRTAVPPDAPDPAPARVRPDETPPAPPPVRRGEAPVPPVRRGETPPPPVRRGETAPPSARRGETAPPSARRGETAPPSARRGETPPPPGRPGGPPARPGETPPPSVPPVGAPGRGGPPPAPGRPPVRSQEAPPPGRVRADRHPPTRQDTTPPPAHPGGPRAGTDGPAGPPYPRGTVGRATTAPRPGARPDGTPRPPPPSRGSRAAPDPVTNRTAVPQAPVPGPPREPQRPGSPSERDAGPGGRVHPPAPPGGAAVRPLRAADAGGSAHPAGGNDAGGPDRPPAPGEAHGNGDHPRTDHPRTERPSTERPRTEQPTVPTNTPRPVPPDEGRT